MNSILGGINLSEVELPEVRTVIAFETKSLIELGLTVFLTAIIIALVIKRI